MRLYESCLRSRLFAHRLDQVLHDRFSSIHVVFEHAVVKEVVEREDPIHPIAVQSEPVQSSSRSRDSTEVCEVTLGQHLLTSVIKIAHTVEPVLRGLGYGFVMCIDVRSLFEEGDHQVWQAHCFFCRHLGGLLSPRPVLLETRIYNL